ncbi:MAG: SAM-dependent methyltransferase, partial [Hyphomicrobium sp.]|nr:SAM-dependent methyltransferase [Hyphomicrobium sp.]
KRERLAEIFGSAAAIKAEPRAFAFRYRSPQHFLDVFKNYYGPLLKAFEALEPPKQAALHADVLDLIARFNRSGDDTMVVPSEYLEVVITKR